jgi:hypothetical protein
MVEQVASGNATAFLCFAVRQNISCELVAPIKAVVAVAILPWLRTFFFVVVAVQVVVWVLRVVVAEIALDFFECESW